MATMNQKGTIIKRSLCEFIFQVVQKMIKMIQHQILLLIFKKVENQVDFLGFFEVFSKRRVENTKEVSGIMPKK